MSAGNPWMKFYPSDWRADQSLRVVSLAARGLWIECMCIMHEAEPYGHLLINGRPPTDAQLAALAGTPLDQIPGLLDELESAGVFSRTRNSVIYSRRMTRDDKRRKDGKKSQKEGTLKGSRRAKQAPEKQPKKSPPPEVVREVAERPPSPQKPEARGQRPEAANAARRAQAVGKEFLRAIGADWEAHEANGRDYGVVRNWLMAGYTEAEIMAVAKRRTDLAGKANPLAYANKLMAEEVEKARAKQRAEDAPPVDREAAQWRQRLKGWRDNGFWLPAWGPKPGEAGCNAPAALVREFDMEEAGS